MYRADEQQAEMYQSRNRLYQGSGKVWSGKVWSGCFGSLPVVGIHVACLKMHQAVEQISFKFSQDTLVRLRGSTHQLVAWDMCRTHQIRVWKVTAAQCDTAHPTAVPFKGRSGYILQIESTLPHVVVVGGLRHLHCSQVAREHADHVLA